MKKKIYGTGSLNGPIKRLSMQDLNNFFRLDKNDRDIFHTACIEDIRKRLEQDKRKRISEDHFVHHVSKNDVEYIMNFVVDKVEKQIFVTESCYTIVEMTDLPISKGKSKYTMCLVSTDYNTYNNE